MGSLASGQEAGGRLLVAAILACCMIYDRADALPQFQLLLSPLPPSSFRGPFLIPFLFSISYTILLGCCISTAVLEAVEACLKPKKPKTLVSRGWGFPFFQLRA